MNPKSKKSIIGSMFRAAFISSVFVEITNTCSGVVDGIIISKILGAGPMAAQGIFQPFFTLLLIFSGTLVSGIQNFSLSYFARGNTKDPQKGFSLCLVVGIVISVIIAAFIYFFAETVAVWMGATGNAAELLADTVAYIRGIAPGVLSLLLCPVIASVLQMDSHGDLVIKGSIALLVVNAVLDIVFCKLGMGMLGVGLATSISSFVNLCILLSHFARKEKLFFLSVKNPGWEYFGKISYLGIRKAVVNLAYSLGMILLNYIMIAEGGTTGMTALSIKNSFICITFCPIMAVTTAIVLLTGMAYGEKNEEECKEIGKKAHTYSLVYGIGIIVLLTILAKPLSILYGASDGELASMLRFGFIMIGLNMLLDSFILSRSAYLQATRQISKANWLSVIEYLLVPVPVGFVLGKLFGAYGVIATYTVACLLILIFIYIYVAVESKKLAPSVDDFMRLPKKFHLETYDVIELSIENEEQAVTVGQQVQLFCKGHKINKQKGYKAALCMEEISTNVFRHGAKEQKKMLPVDVRVTISNGDIIMKIRDKCPRFDLSERIKQINNQENAEKNIGIKMISRTAKDIRYINLMDTNTLLITV